MPWVTWLINLIPGLNNLVQSFFGWLNKKEDTKVVQIQTDATTDVALTQTQASIVIAEQNKWYTASIRPLCMFPFVGFLWKAVLFDKVIAPLILTPQARLLYGHTDPLGTDMWGLFMLMAGAYFLMRPSEKRR